MTTKHTPGEWNKLNTPDGFAILCKTNTGTKRLAELKYPPTTMGIPNDILLNEQQEANAKLMVVAPELLEELINFCENAIHEKKIALNQLSYFKGRFNKIIKKATE